MFKDEILTRLSAVGNVAQFISFAPDLTLRHSTGHTGVAELLAASGRVNIRSFIPGDHQSKEFVYGLSSADDVRANLSRLSSQGLFTIVNELIDTSDGGVSGVKQDGVIEFAPDDTPRCVEKPGICALAEDLGRRVLRTVYGAELPHLGGRFEFSVHPVRCGTRHETVILWEHEAEAETPVVPLPSWPNRFSRHIGDKAFGLLVADALSLPVPRTTVLARKLAPFSFGDGGEGVWVRTCPTEQQPGLYTTVKGWADPFAILTHEDPSGANIASVLVQSGVPATHSGAAIMTADGELVIEGNAGFGDDFMLGASLPQSLPQTVTAAVREVSDRIVVALGAGRFEWVYDGMQAWVVQLHAGRSCSASDGTIVPGEAAEWVSIETGSLADLRNALAELPPGTGVILRGEFGLTSHIADVVRKAGFPARKLAA